MQGSTRDAHLHSPKYPQNSSATVYERHRHALDPQGDGAPPRGPLRRTGSRASPTAVRHHRQSTELPDRSRIADPRAYSHLAQCRPWHGACRKCRAAARRSFKRANKPSGRAPIRQTRQQAERWSAHLPNIPSDLTLRRLIRTTRRYFSTGASASAAAGFLAHPTLPRCRFSLVRPTAAASPRTAPRRGPAPACPRR